MMRSPVRFPGFVPGPVAALFVLLTSALVALAAPDEARAADRNFAGSAQIDYHLVPTAKEANARAVGFDGFTLETAAKVAVDFSDKLSANLKLCYGCHGFETDMAYFDFRVGDELAFRFGRFSPSFGAFNIRHDPANHRASDKPLPYDMGRMLRLRAWNMGVLPSPFPDNGVEANGKLTLADEAALEYAVYAVSGFKADHLATDLDFQQSRDGSLYYVDNNGRPTVGGRLAFTLTEGSLDMTLGGSAMHGTFDPTNSLTYTILGADLSVRIGRTNFRLEYLVRRQDMDVSDPTRFAYQPVPNGDYFVKHGAYAEIEQPLTSTIDLLLRADGMMRVGNVPVLSPGSPMPADGVLARRSTVGRFTLGTAFSIDRSLRLKASGEVWQFSDRDASAQVSALSLHLGAVGTF